MKKLLQWVWVVLFGLLGFGAWAQQGDTEITLSCEPFQYFHLKPSLDPLFFEDNIAWINDSIAGFQLNSDCNPHNIEIRVIVLYPFMNLHLCGIEDDENILEYRDRLDSLAEETEVLEEDADYAAQIKQVDSLLTEVNRIIATAENICFPSGTEEKIIVVAYPWANVDCQTIDDLRGRDEFIAYFSGDYVEQQEAAIEAVMDAAAADRSLVKGSDMPNGSFTSLYSEQFFNYVFGIIQHQQAEECAPPSIGLAKHMEADMNVVNNQDGYRIAIRLMVENFQEEALSNIQIRDDLSAMVPCGDIDQILFRNNSWDWNDNYGENGDWNLLSGDNTLAVGERHSLEFLVDITGCGGVTIDNQAVVTATDGNGLLYTDTSTMADTFPFPGPMDSDPDLNGDPTDNNDPTVLALPSLSPYIGIAKKETDIFAASEEGPFLVKYSLVLKNYSNQPFSEVQIRDLPRTIISPAPLPDINYVGCDIKEIKLSSDGTALSVNSNYGENNDWNLLAEPLSLAAGEEKILELEFRFENTELNQCVGGNKILNSALVTAMSSINVPLEDRSTDGDDPDRNGDNDPTNDTLPTFTVLPGATSSPLGLAKQIVLLEENEDGSYTVTFDLIVENYSGFTIEDISISDPLSQFLPECTFEVLSVNSEDGLLTPNPSYGTSNSGTVPYNPMVVNANDALGPGAQAVVRVTLKVTDGVDPAIEYYNTAQVSGTINDGEFNVADVSQEGNNPDPDGNGKPEDNDEPTLLIFNTDPVVGISKHLLDSTHLPNGSIELEMELIVENFGFVNLVNLEVTDDLGAFMDETFTEWEYLGFEPFVENQLTWEANMPDPSADATLVVTSTGSLAPRNQEKLRFRILVNRYNSDHTYENTATVVAFNEAGETVEDASVEGTAPDADGDGDPGNDEGPTVVELPYVPSCLEEMGKITEVVTSFRRTGPNGQGDLVIEWSAVEGAEDYYLLFGDKGAPLKIGYLKGQSYFEESEETCSVVRSGLNRYKEYEFVIIPVCSAVDFTGMQMDPGEYVDLYDNGYVYNWHVNQITGAFIYEDQIICEGQTARLGIAYQYNGTEPDCANEEIYDFVNPENYLFEWKVVGSTSQPEFPCFDATSCNGGAYCSRTNDAPVEDTDYFMTRRHINAVLLDTLQEATGSNYEAIDTGFVSVDVILKDDPDYEEKCEFDLEVYDQNPAYCGNDGTVDARKANTGVEEGNEAAIGLVKWGGYNTGESYVTYGQVRANAYPRGGMNFEFGYGDPTWTFNAWGASTSIILPSTFANGTLKISSSSYGNSSGYIPSESNYGQNAPTPDETWVGLTEEGGYEKVPYEVVENPDNRHVEELGLWHGQAGMITENQTNESFSITAEANDDGDNFMERTVNVAYFDPNLKSEQITYEDAFEDDYFALAGFKAAELLCEKVEEVIAIINAWLKLENLFENLLDPNPPLPGDYDPVQYESCIELPDIIKNIIGDGFEDLCFECEVFDNLFIELKEKCSSPNLVENLSGDFGHKMEFSTDYTFESEDVITAIAALGSGGTAVPAIQSILERIENWTGCSINDLPLAPKLKLIVAAGGELKTNFDERNFLLTGPDPESTFEGALSIEFGMDFGGEFEVETAAELLSELNPCGEDNTLETFLELMNNIDDLFGEDIDVSVFNDQLPYTLDIEYGFEISFAAEFVVQENDPIGLCIFLELKGKAPNHLKIFDTQAGEDLIEWDLSEEEGSIRFRVWQNSSGDCPCTAPDCYPITN